MASIKDSLKKVVQAAKKTTQVSQEGLYKMQKIAEAAKQAAKTPGK